MQFFSCVWLVAKSNYVVADFFSYRALVLNISRDENDFDFRIDLHEFFCKIHTVDPGHHNIQKRGVNRMVLRIIQKHVDVVHKHRNLDRTVIHNVFDKVFQRIEFVVNDHYIHFYPPSER